MRNSNYNKNKFNLLQAAWIPVIREIVQLFIVNSRIRLIRTIIINLMNKNKRQTINKLSKNTIRNKDIDLIVVLLLRIISRVNFKSSNQNN